MVAGPPSHVMVAASSGPEMPIDRRLAQNAAAGRRLGLKHFCSEVVADDNEDKRGFIWVGFMECASAAKMAPLGLGFVGLRMFRPRFSVPGFGEIGLASEGSKLGLIA